MSVPVLMGEQPERARQGTVAPAVASIGIGLGGVELPMTPAWKYWHERTRHVGVIAPQPKSSQGTKNSTRSALRGRRR